MSEEKLYQIIRANRVCMVTTYDPEIGLRSRPMAAQKIDGDGCIWFYADAESSKVAELQHNGGMNLSFCNPSDSTYASVTAKGEIVRDEQRIRALWNPFLKAWFPHGLETPGLCLIKATPTAAEYWDAAGSRLIQMVKIGKAILTGKQYDSGTNERVCL